WRRKPLPLSKPGAGNSLRPPRFDLATWPELGLAPAEISYWTRHIRVPNWTRHIRVAPLVRGHRGCAKQERATERARVKAAADRITLDCDAPPVTTHSEKGGSRATSREGSASTRSGLVGREGRGVGPHRSSGQRRRQHRGRP